MWATVRCRHYYVFCHDVHSYRLYFFYFNIDAVLLRGVKMFSDDKNFSLCSLCLYLLRYFSVMLIHYVLILMTFGVKGDFTRKC
jgi:hypothetical protein